MFLITDCVSSKNSESNCTGIFKYSALGASVKLNII